MTPEQDTVAHETVYYARLQGVLKMLARQLDESFELDRAKISVEKSAKMADANFRPGLPGVRPS